MHLECWRCEHYLGDWNLFMRGDGVIVDYSGNSKTVCLGCGNMTPLSACDPVDGTEGQIRSLN